MKIVQMNGYEMKLEFNDGGELVVTVEPPAPGGTLTKQCMFLLNDFDQLEIMDMITSNQKGTRIRKMT